MTLTTQKPGENCLTRVMREFQYEIGCVIRQSIDKKLLSTVGQSQWTLLILTE